jgi:hypothetical protein
MIASICFEVLIKFLTNAVGGGGDCRLRWAEPFWAEVQLLLAVGAYTWFSFVCRFCFECRCVIIVIALKLNVMLLILHAACFRF